MNKNDFVRLLEQYKNKALNSLQKEAEVTAMTLITPEFHELSEKIDEVAFQLTSAYKSLVGQFNEIVSQNPSLGRPYFSYSVPNTKMESSAVYAFKHKLMENTEYQKKNIEIKNKFDAAIRTAKQTKSSKKLLDLAVALGVEVDSIEVEGDVSQNIDTPFLKEKINAVKLLS
jgi:hypothetical protein